jgi:hypothetical protein
MPTPSSRTRNAEHASIVADVYQNLARLGVVERIAERFSGNPVHSPRTIGFNDSGVSLADTCTWRASSHRRLFASSRSAVRNSDMRGGLLSTRSAYRDTSGSACKR